MCADDYTRRMHWHIERVMRQKPIFFPNLKAHYSFARADEVAKFLLWLATDNTVDGAINASSAEPVRLSDFMEAIEKSCGRKSIYAAKADDNNHSPYGVSEDYYLSVEKLRQSGYAMPASKEWFYPLVKVLCEDYPSWSC